MPRPVLIIAVTAVLVVGGFAAWLLTQDDDDTNPEERLDMDDQLATDDPTAEQVDAALEFAYVELPPGAEVERLVFQSGVDQRYQLLVAVPPAAEEELLQESNFTGTFGPTGSPGDYAVSGAELPANPTAVVATDTVESNGTLLVSREILVDRTDPELTRLHISAFNF